MNTIVTLLNGHAVTTSLAISEGTKVQHKNVLELARTYLVDLEEFGLVAFETRPFETAGGQQEREIAILNEQQSTLLLTYMRNSDVVRQFKKALVKAFYELMKAPAPDPMKLLADPAAMRGLLLNYTERVIALEETVKSLEPKAEALDRFATVTEGSFCIRDAAKTLQAKEKNLIQLLVEKQWMYRRPMGTGYLAYSDKLQSGLMEHKVTTGEKSDGSEWASTQARITARGLAKLSQLMSSNKPEPRPT